LDIQLFSDLQANDPKAMDEIYEAWWEKLFDFAYGKVGDEDVARDVVQEVLIYLWENRQQLNVETSLSAYLHQAVKYRILNYYKANSIRQSHQEHLIRLADSALELQAESIMMYKEMQGEIDQAVKELPEKMQVVFRMSKISGKSNPEIAAELGISLQTVKNQLSSAVKILKKSLSYLHLLILYCLTQS